VEPGGETAYALAGTAGTAGMFTFAPCLLDQAWPMGSQKSLAVRVEADLIVHKIFIHSYANT
jgi:hypothetical protein